MYKLIEIVKNIYLQALTIDYVYIFYYYFI